MRARHSTGMIVEYYDAQFTVRLVAECCYGITVTCCDALKCHIVIEHYNRYCEISDVLIGTLLQTIPDFPIGNIQ